MIDKTVFKEIKNLKKECKDLESRINAEENTVLIDSVKGSSTEYPYVQHNCKIEGIQDYRRYKKYKKMLKNKRRDLEKKITNLEYQMNYIDDSEIRQIIRYKYEDDMNWIQIMHKMNFNNEDTARKKLERFLEKI